MAKVTRESLIVVGILAVTVVVAILVIYMPQGRKLEMVRRQISSQKQRLDTDAQKAQVVPEMLRQVHRMKKQYRNFDRKLPKRKELGGFLREISANLGQEKLSNQLIEPGNPTRERLFHTLPIIMKFHGSYLALANFLQRIGKMERVTRVQKLRVANSTKDGLLDIELQLNIYFTES